MASPPLRVLLLAPNWLGDAVMSLPLVGQLGSIPSLALSVLAPPYTARIYLGLHQVAEVMIYSRRGRLAKVARAVRAARGLSPRACLILPPSFASALIALLAGISERIGFAGEGRGLLLSRSLSRPQPGEEHLSASYLRLGRELADILALPSPRQHRPPAPALFPREVAEAKRLLTSLGLGGGYAVLAPGADYGPAKAWPLERFRAVAAGLSRSRDVVLVGTASEADSCREIGNNLPRVYNLAGMTRLGVLMALLARAGLVVANDSGVAHLAAGLGAPTIVIFGSTSPSWTVPLGPHVRVLQAKVDCSPCFRRECPRGLECFLAVEPAQVLRAAEQFGKKGSMDAT